MWLALFLFFLPSNLPTSADALPTDHFIETFEHYDFADGARTTAWWDRNNGRLTLRQPDAGNTRRWPTLAVAESGDLTNVWVEDRGEGPLIWAQTLDRHGNRWWEEDQAVTAWQGDWLANPPDFHPMALSPAQTGGF